MPDDVIAGTEIRPPWPDEMERVRALLPRCFQAAGPTALAVATQGEAGRIVAAAARVGAANGRPGELLRWRLTAEKHRTLAVLAPLLALALAEATDTVRITAFLEEQGPEATVLRAHGFVAGAVQQVFEIDASPLYERLAALHARLASRGLIPADARVVPLTDAWLPAARHLFAQHLPDEEPRDTEALLLGHEHAGFRHEHSFVLLVGHAVQGLLLSHYADGVSHVGAVLVAPELRGGLGWAQTFLLQGTRPPAAENPVKTVRFTADERLHPNSVQFARLWDGRLVGRWVRLSRPAP